MANYWDGAYDLDIAVDIINSMWVDKRKALKVATDSNSIQAIQTEIELLGYEKDAVYLGGDLQKSLIDKAFRLYAPILKMQA